MEQAPGFSATADAPFFPPVIADAFSPNAAKLSPEMNYDRDDESDNTDGVTPVPLPVEKCTPEQEEVPRAPVPTHLTPVPENCVGPPPPIPGDATRYAEAADGNASLPPPYSVFIDKSGSQKFGLDVKRYSKTSLEVLRINEGLVTNYNNEVEKGNIVGFKVEIGDVLDAVNDFTGPAEQILSQIAKCKQMRLRFQKGLPPKVRGCN